MAFPGISMASLLGATAATETSFTGDAVDNTGSTILTAVSAGALATSMRLFISSDSSQRKATDLSLRQEGLLPPGHVTSSCKTFPVTSLVIQFSSLLLKSIFVFATLTRH